MTQESDSRVEDSCGIPRAIGDLEKAASKQLQWEIGHLIVRSLPCVSYLGRQHQESCSTAYLTAANVWNISVGLIVKSQSWVTSMTVGNAQWQWCKAAWPESESEHESESEPGQISLLPLLQCLASAPSLPLPCSQRIGHTGLGMGFIFFIRIFLLLQWWWWWLD